MVEEAQNLDCCLPSGDVGTDAKCGKMFAFRTSARPLTGHGASNLNLNRHHLSPSR
jgi:hypothetical protein